MGLSLCPGGDCYNSRDQVHVQRKQREENVEAPRDTLTPLSLHPTCDPVPGTGGLGNRGTGWLSWGQAHHSYSGERLTSIPYKLDMLPRARGLGVQMVTAFSAAGPQACALRPLTQLQEMMLSAQELWHGRVFRHPPSRCDTMTSSVSQPQLSFHNLDPLRRSASH